jgi:flavin-binding protein dodecin
VFSRQEDEVDDIRWFDIDGIEDHVDDDMAWRIQRIQKYT